MPQKQALGTRKGQRFWFWGQLHGQGAGWAWSVAAGRS